MIQIPIISVVLLTGFAWLLAVICFEAGYQALRKKHAVTVSKGMACRIWWLFLSVCTLAGGVQQFLVSLPFLGTMGISHCGLAETKDEVITLAEILRNIPAALRDFLGKLRPYIK